MTLNTTPPTDAEETQNPGLSLAMELAQFVREEIQKLDRSVKEQVAAALQANAQTVKRMGQLEESVSRLAGDLDMRARERAEKDVQEAKTRYDLAQRQLDKLSTQEKIQVQEILEGREEAAKKARADRWRALWDKILPNIVGAMILAVLIPVWLAIVIAILGFILRALGIQIPLPS